MKIKALIDCNGLGYENLTAGESRDVHEGVGVLLVSFGYAESEEVQGEDTGKKKKAAEADEKPDDSTDPAAEADEKL